MKRAVRSSPQATRRRGLALIPVLAILVAVTLFAGLSARRQVREFRIFETARRQAVARQAARGEALRIRADLAAGRNVEPARRVVSGDDIPGLPEPMEIRVESGPGMPSRLRVIVSVPAGDPVPAAREVIEVP